MRFSWQLNMYRVVFWVVMNLWVGTNILEECSVSILALKMEDVYSSNMLAPIHNPTEYHNPEHTVEKRQFSVILSLTNNYLEKVPISIISILLLSLNSLML
jgi:hypothetical protein